MNIYKPTAENIKKAADLIKVGELVSFPTETVYGLGADAMNPIAVAKIFKAKERPFFDPLIVHIAQTSMLDYLTIKNNPITEKLIEKFWPGPLTLIFDKKETVPDIITSGLPTIAVRMPSHPVALDFIRAAETPIAAPSANKFGCLSPTTANHVKNQIGKLVDVILDGGTCHVGIESTIIRIIDEDIFLLRPGGTAIEDIENHLNIKVKQYQYSETPQAPGQLPYHYSPEKPVIIENDIPLIDNDAGFLLFKKPNYDFPAERTMILSNTGNLVEAAASLFSCLHRLDSMNIKRIYAQPVPPYGLGLAIMDRLIKASKKYK